MDITKLDGQFLLKNFFYGVATVDKSDADTPKYSLVDKGGNEFPPDTIEMFIKAAISYVESELSIKIIPTKPFSENQDYNSQDYVRGYGYIRLNKIPVIEVIELVLSYGSNKITTFPADWLQLRKDTGILQVLPAYGSMSQMVALNSGVILPLSASFPHALPGVWKITYRAGMLDVEADLAQIICKQAACSLYMEYGETMFPVGLDSFSLGIDGMNQSLQSSRSKGSVFAGRIEQYKKDIKEALGFEPNIGYLRRKYEGLQLTVL